GSGGRRSHGARTGLRRVVPAGHDERRSMSSPPTRTKAELLEALQASRDEVIAIVRTLPPEQLEEGRYENGWTGRQILAHIASIEWTYPRLIDIAREATAAPDPASSTREPPTRTMP